MKRTSDRPLPAGRLASGDVQVFGAILSMVGLVYLALTVNLLTAFLGALTLGVYLFVYTPLKKVTPLCTLVGAVPGAIPPMMGWTGATDSIGSGAWILFCILFFWQMPHFFALARLYREDYARGGFPMLSVVDPDGMRTGLQIVAHTLLLLPASLAPTLFGMTGMVYFYSALVLSIGFLATGVWAAFDRTDSSSKKLFLASIAYLPLILILMVVDKLPA
jgi:protoheme IX farnesyltransferase